MRDMLFAAVWGGATILAVPSANAQSVPGRDLLDFTVGALAEGPALAVEAAGGLYNPAALLLAPAGATRAPRLRAAAAQLSSPGERGLTGQMVSVVAAPSARWGAAATVARVGVSDIQRTETDPTTTLGTIPYDAVVASAAGSVRVQRHLLVGAALRYRLGRADTTRAAATGVDVGVVADRLFGRLDARVAAASYLWRPGAHRDDRPAALGAVDARVYGDGALREARVGYSLWASRGGGQESYLYAAGRYRYFEGRVGAVQVTAFGRPETQSRLGLGLHYARLSATVARQSGGFLGPVYQFTLSTVLQ